MQTAIPSAGSPGIRALIVHHDEHVVWGLRKLLELAEPPLAVVGVARTLERALDAGRATEPDVILLDAHVVAGDFVGAIGVLRDAVSAEIVVLAGAEDAQDAERMRSSGAHDVVSMEEPGRHLLQVVRDAFRLAHQREARVGAAAAAQAALARLRGRP